MQIIVRDNNVDQALRALKKKLQREGVFREMKLRRHYEKPSEKRAREPPRRSAAPASSSASAPSATAAGHPLGSSCSPAKAGKPRLASREGGDVSPPFAFQGMIMSVTAVPLHPLKKGSVAKLWIALILLAALAAAFAWWGTSAFQPVKTGSEVTVRTLAAGAGAKITDQDVVALHYKLHVKSLDAAVVEDSRAGGQPLVTTTQGVYPGFGEGLQHMRPGGSYILTLPPGTHLPGPIRRALRSRRGTASSSRSTSSRSSPAPARATWRCSACSSSSRCSRCSNSRAAPRAAPKAARRRRALARSEPASARVDD